MHRKLHRHMHRHHAFAGGSKPPIPNTLQLRCRRSLGRARRASRSEPGGPAWLAILPTISPVRECAPLRSRTGGRSRSRVGDTRRIAAGPRRHEANGFGEDAIKLRLLSRPSLREVRHTLRLICCNGRDAVHDRRHTFDRCGRHNAHSAPISSTLINASSVRTPMVASTPLAFIKNAPANGSERRACPLTAESVAVRKVPAAACLARSRKCRSPPRKAGSPAPVSESEQGASTAQWP